MYQRKYEKGKQVKDLRELENLPKYGFIWNDKWYANGWIISWQYHWLCAQISSGRLYYAELTEHGRKQRMKELAQTLGMNTLPSYMEDLI